MPVSPEPEPVTPPVAPAVARRRVLRRTARGLAAVFGLLLGALAWIAAVGITIDAAPFRDRLAQAFAHALDREVRFDGPALLELSGQPRLRVGGLHVSDPGGFSRGTFATLGEARLALDLWALLGRRLHVGELAGQDVTIRLVARPGGGNNWTFPAAGPAAGAAPAGPRQDGGGSREAALMLDIQRVSLERLKVTYSGADGRQHAFDLDDLAGESPRGKPLTLTLRGSVDGTFPYRLDFTGGALSDLAGSATPWPFRMRLEFLSTALALQGNVGGAGGEFLFAVGTEDLHELERLLQTSFPKVGAVGIAGNVSVTPGRIAVTGLTGVMGRTTLAGELVFDRAGPRPRVSGKLTLPALDLRPFLTDRPDRPDEPPQSLRETYRELAEATFSLRALQAADVEVELAVDRWLSLPGDVHDARLRLHLAGGRLDMPVQAVIAGVTLTGNARADGSADPPRFELGLGTKDSDLGGLAHLLAGIPGIAGRLGRFDLALKARGDSGRELLASLDVRLDVDEARLSYGNDADGRPVRFALDRFALSLPPGEPLSVKARGSLLGQPTRLQATGGTLERVMLDERTPLDVQLRSGTLRGRVHGTLAAPSDTAGPEVRFDLSAERTDDVARWLGLTAGAGARVALAGRAAMTLRQARLDDFSLRLGRSSLKLAASRALGTAHPLLRLQLDADTIDAAELQSLLPAAPRRQASTGEAARPVLEIPILPQGIDLGEADVQVRIHRIEGTPLAPRGIAFDGRIRNGAMEPSSFSATIADVAFRGALAVDLRGAEPASNLWLSTGQVDVGRLLRRFGLASRLDATVESLRLSLAARSSLLGNLLARSELIGNVDRASITLRDANTGARMQVAVNAGELRASPGAPVRLDLDGTVDTVPIRIGLQTASAADLVRPGGSIPFRLDATVPDLTVRLDGDVAKPVGTGEIALDLAVAGTRLDRLDGLVRASLPPWGPYALRGRFHISPEGYDVSGLDLRVGSSELRGRGSLRTRGPKPRLDIALTAPAIQLDDFRVGNWSPAERKPEDDRTLTPSEVKARAAAASDEAQKLLSPAVLDRQDAFLDVTVDRVLSGADALGSGRLQAKLEHGRAEIGPVEVHVPGGSATLWLGYEPGADDVQVNTRVAIDRFDYGILARRIRPDTDLSGTFSFQMEVASRARYLSDILKSGTGRIEFSVWPVNMKSGIFDLWAVNVLVALVPAVDPGSASRINCAIGRFQLENGQLTDRMFVLDTSRMRVTGKGRADFARERVDLRMQPTAKTPQFLSLATPIDVRGTFGDFRIGPSAGDVLGTIGRFATSIFWVPIQKLVSKDLPADGRDICAGPR